MHSEEGRIHSELRADKMDSVREDRCLHRLTA